MIIFINIIWQKKQAALQATQGLMVLGDQDITMDDALRAFDEESKKDNQPTILGQN